MRTLLVIAVVMMVSTMIWAQMPIPGTFSSVPAQPLQYGTPILSTPTVSLGNGLTPTVITNQQAVLVSAPQNVSMEASMVPPGVKEVATPPNTGTVGAVEAQRQPQMTVERAGSAATKRFDFVVSSRGSVAAGRSDQQSLGEVAAATRKPGVTPVSGKAFTNDDIARMNQKYGVQKQQSAEPKNPGPGESTSADSGVSGAAVQAGTAQQNQLTTQPAPAYANPVKK